MPSNDSVEINFLLIKKKKKMLTEICLVSSVDVILALSWASPKIVDQRVSKLAIYIYIY